MPAPVHHVSGDEQLADKLQLLLAGTTQQLILDGMTPSGLLLRFFVLSPGDGLSIQVFLWICGNQFDRFGFTLRFDRPGFGDLEIFHTSFTSFPGIASLLLFTTAQVMNSRQKPLCVPADRSRLCPLSSAALGGEYSQLMGRDTSGYTRTMF